MNRWVGRVALVTGASSGIGLVIAEKLVSQGMIVVGCGRNVSAIEKLKERCITAKYKGQLYPYKCDITKEAEIDAMFQWVSTNLSGGVDVCVNNAGFSTNTSLLEIPVSEMRSMLDTNIVALVQCSQLSIKSMIQRNVNDGHIININSTLGHHVLGIFNFYASTKFAVTALTQGFQKDMASKGLRIKFSSISPGRTETNFLHTALGSENAARAYSTMENLQPEDVADSVLHVLASPPHVQIKEVMIEPIQPTPPGGYSVK
ncbi:dehydrogenase/reductase SDR family member 11 [Folsomia candida]|uniref:Dehydrogenase/reductase SDR family member 11 n=1 Tax=Folsomia candida TaxID=158441 RepID=A0A226EE35_FOLCA|nr:dehydrogenase/reductase SDR family member 11 [Folsomia candida]OXA55394.1 Dehydrogenase/reductase SDR family member 11 [Folsomia candida]